MIVEIVKFFIYAMLIVMISKLMLVKALRKLSEILKLKPRTIGNIAGVATSIPEFLTVTVSSFKGLANTSLYNILSSNIINFIQYILSIIINKNYKELRNKAIIIELIIVIVTILIPIFLLNYEKEIDVKFALTFIILYIGFSIIIKKVHEKYFYEEKSEEEDVLDEKVKSTKKYVYILIIILSGILLYIIGNALGDVLENLSELFGIAEFILGILLGMITSIPELITFFESQKHYREKESNKFLGVIEATNNLLSSNMINLFLIQSLGIIIYVMFWNCTINKMYISILNQKSTQY